MNVEKMIGQPYQRIPDESRVRDATCALVTSASSSFWTIYCLSDIVLKQWHSLPLFFFGFQRFSSSLGKQKMEKK
jgi:hypothetical protein